MVRALLALCLALANGAARGDVILLSSARTSGARDSAWRTDIQIVNPSVRALTLQAIFSDHAAGGREVTGPEVTLPAQGQVTYVDALASIFGAAPPAYGPIRVVADGPVVVGASVYTTNPCGRVAFSFRGVETSTAMSAGLIAQLSGGSSTRANLILLNPSDSGATVQLRALPGQPKTVALGPGEWRQINDVLSFVQSGASRPLLAFSSNVPILAMATVIDNESGQAVAVLPYPIDAYRLVGLAFSPYVDGQDPNLGSRASEEQLTERMRILQPYTQWIRTFGSGNGLEVSGRVAHALGLKAALGAWLGRDAAANEREIQNLIAAGKAGEADLLIVGSEVMLRGDLSESALLAAMERVRREVPGVPVSTADTYDRLLAHPALIQASDIVLANYYPYWEGVPVNLAVAALHDAHKRVLAAAAGKPVWVSETGWPSGGNPVGEAVPSPENAAFYFANFVSWARSTGTRYLYFTGLDESWKARYEGPQGAVWGILDKNGVMKPGMQAVFDGATVPDNWSAGSIPGGPGKPSVELTDVPPRGSTANLKGRVLHVNPPDFKLAVYIYVSDWWTKPTWAQPLTPIQRDGTWVCDITTGGNDTSATRIAAFLLPNGYDPPKASGQSTLPSELATKAVASAEVSR